MKKILKNITVNDIDLVKLGILIEANSSEEVFAEDYLLLSSDDVIAEITPYITAGDIVVNNGVHDITDTTIAINFLKFPDDALNVHFANDAERGNGISAETVQEAIEEVAIANNKDRFSVTFGRQGGVKKNKYLYMIKNIPSNKVPFIVPYSCLLHEISAAAKANNNTEIGIFVNGTQQASILFNNSKKEVVSGLSVSLSSGDEIKIKGISNNKAKDVVLTLFMKHL